MIRNWPTLIFIIIKILIFLGECMKTIGKSVAKKIALLIVLVGLLGLGWWYLTNHNPFNGSAKT